MNVYFATNPYYLTDNYSPEVIQLAYGFRELGWKVSGNVDYWPITEGFLIPKGERSGTDVLIVDHRFAYHTKPWVLQSYLNGFETSIKILLDRQCGQELTPQWNRDGMLDMFSNLLVTDRTHYHPKNGKIHPWQIGCIPEVRRAIEGNRSSKPEHLFEQLAIVCSFRVSHSVRDEIVSSIEEFTKRPECRFRLDFNTVVDSVPHALNDFTGGRFNLSYFSMLNESSATLAIGGYKTLLPIRYLYYDSLGRLSKRPWDKIIQRFSLNRQAVIQWDSFRIWESMISDTAPVLLDFDEWRLDLPVKPEPWIHYIPIGSDFSASIEQINSLSMAEVRNIGVNGKAWFVENYSPIVQVRRLLSLIDL